MPCFFTRDLNSDKNKPKAVVARNEKPPLNTRCERTFAFEIREIDEENRRVHVSFSSEKPVERWFVLKYYVTTLQPFSLIEFANSELRCSTTIAIYLSEFLKMLF